MHLAKNFDWDLKLSDKELLILIKLLKGQDLNDDETQLADHLESVLPMIREKQLDTRPSAARRPFNGHARNRNGHAKSNGNGNGNGELHEGESRLTPALAGEIQT